MEGLNHIQVSILLDILQYHPFLRITTDSRIHTPIYEVLSSSTRPVPLLLHFK